MLPGPIAYLGRATKVYNAPLGAFFVNPTECHSEIPLSILVLGGAGGRLVKSADFGEKNEKCVNNTQW